MIDDGYQGEPVPYDGSMRWVSSLSPVVLRDRLPARHRRRMALRLLADALAHCEGGYPYLRQTQLAAAHVVAWRRSLPDGGARHASSADMGPLDRIRCSIQLLAEAGLAEPRPLRMVEGHLRAIWKEGVR